MTDSRRISDEELVRRTKAYLDRLTGGDLPLTFRPTQASRVWDRSQHLRPLAVLGVSVLTASVVAAAIGLGLALHIGRVAQTNPSSSWQVAETSSGWLSGVACVSADDCWAVGYESTGSAPATIHHYDGKTWSTAAASANSRLEAVSCVSSVDCWAVGSTGDQPVALIEHYAGHEWGVVTPNLAYDGPGSELEAITCLDATSCWAAGSTVGGSVQPLFLQLTVNGWSTVASSPVEEAGRIHAIACVSVDECWAVGSAGVGIDTPGHSLVEHYLAGHWAVAPAPGITGSLQGVTCNDAHDCWAVGSRLDGTPSLLIERYSGGRWSVEASPVLIDSTHPGSELMGAQLQSVACVSASDCWAVGFDNTTAGPRHLGVNQQVIIKYRGGAWSLVAGPTTDNVLNGIACPAPRRCWAVGTNGVRAVIETNEANG